MILRGRALWGAALALALGFAPAAGAQSGGRDASLPTVVRTVMSFDAFAAQVRRAHPVVRQARLLVEQARAEQRVARGAFDPSLAAAWERKTFGSTTYYDYAVAKLTLPTPLGVDLVVGYENAQGPYINPDRRTPAGGLVTAGLSLPLGQRMVTDERRTALVVAHALRTAADAERDGAVIRVVVQSARDYAAWYEAWRRAAVAAEGLALAQFRLDAVRRSVRAGEAAPIDTIEAALERDRREVQRGEATQAAYAARLRAEAHLWGPAGEPVALPDDAEPMAATAATVSVDSSSVARWIANAIRTHPDVRRAGGRAQQAGAQRDLALQQLLPAIEIQGALLGGADERNVALGGRATDDAKLGATARFPLLLLRERGRLAGAAAREAQLLLDQARTARDVALAIRVAANDVVTLDRLLTVQRQAVEQARLLRDGEQRRFDAGGSTLFLVNARERAVLDEAVKLAALEAKRLVAEAELAASIGDPDLLR